MARFKRFLFLAAASCLSTAALAAEVDLPVPSAVVYAGKDVLSAGLGTRSFIVKDEKLSLFVSDPSELRGKVARRRLVPGQAIRLSDLTTADSVKAGMPVMLVYQAAGLTITGLGTALQSGAEGEVVQVRNIDSGITVSGVVGSDGSVQVQG